MTIGAPTGPGGVQATAHAVIDGGQVSEIDIDNPGSGYVSAPTVTVGGGTGVTAIAKAIAALRLNAGLNHCSGGANACYPPTVNYPPLYYLINGTAFDKTNSMGSLFPASTVAATPGTTGQVLVRLVNAGLRMHIPSIVGSLTGGTSGFSLIAEDGNKLPGNPRVQSEVFMAAGKTYDVMIDAPAATATALPIFDRQLRLSGNATARDGGMFAYLNINNGSLPLNPGFATAKANDDTYNIVVALQAGNQPIAITDPSKGVIANDINVYAVQLAASPAPTKGTVTLNADGTFKYVANANWASVVYHYCLYIYGALAQVRHGLG